MLHSVTAEQQKTATEGRHVKGTRHKQSKRATMGRLPVGVQVAHSSDDTCGTCGES